MLSRRKWEPDRPWNFAYAEHLEDREERLSYVSCNSDPNQLHGFLAPCEAKSLPFLALNDRIAVLQIAHCRSFRGIPESLPTASSTEQTGDASEDALACTLRLQAKRPLSASTDGAGLLTFTASQSSILGHFRGPFFGAFPSESHKTALAATNSATGQCTSHYRTLPDTTQGRWSLCSVALNY